ncbi:MAG: DUF1934 domain-containing protein [Lachnospiraceae bacterium]|nr:DUF1934 domain-containing protein [Lachnospiraceae bacterium]
MTKDIIITICGLQTGSNTDGQPIESITTGEYYYKNDKHYFLYEEVMEGEIKTTKNRIKLAPGYMELTKKGVVSVHMVFEENSKNITHYYTPYGTLIMGIDTKKVSINETEDEIDIVVEYALEINQEYVADCDIKINVKSKGNKEFHLV